jgi:hypothetical protein
VESICAEAIIIFSWNWIVRQQSSRNEEALERFGQKLRGLPFLGALLRRQRAEVV